MRVYVALLRYTLQFYYRDVTRIQTVRFRSKSTDGRKTIQMILGVVRSIKTTNTRPRCFNLSAALSNKLFDPGWLQDLFSQSMLSYVWETMVKCHRLPPIFVLFPYRKIDVYFPLFFLLSGHLWPNISRAAPPALHCLGMKCLG